MREENHERALQFIDKMRLEGLTTAEREELQAHLETCASCQEQERQTEVALRAFRAAAPRFDGSLVIRTQMQVRVRALEITENAARLRALWISCALSWVLGVVSAPLMWRGFEWIGHRLALSRVVWITGFALAWIAPAVVTAAIIAWRQAERAVGSRQ
jgi:putative zinc finger protein